MYHFRQTNGRNGREHPVKPRLKLSTYNERKVKDI